MFLNKISLVFTLSLLVFRVNSAYPDSNVPVFIWGNSNSILNPSSLSPLAHIEKEQFSSELDKVLKKDTSVVLFVDEKLSPEDFQCTLDDQSCFKNLMNLQKANEFLYFPSVESPVEVLQSKPNVEVVALDSKVTESRQQLLAHHDELMQEKIRSLQNLNKDFVIFYTAKNPSLNVQSNHRVTRQTGNTIAQNEVHNLNDLVLLSFTNFMLYDKNNGHGLLLNNTKVNFSDKSSAEVKVYTVAILDSSYKLELELTAKSGYWSVTKVTFEDGSDTYEMRSSVDIAGVSGFSFHCSPATLFKAKGSSDNTIVTLSDLQIQPFLVKQTNPKFGDSLDCVGFMSAPILAGLFVTFMLAAIVALGICMMMDLKTMDRFEDPKGKTITVTATD